MTTRELLAEYARRMNRHGVDSPEAMELLATNRNNEEFIDLAALSRRLKLYIAPRTVSGPIADGVPAEEEADATEVENG